MKLTHGCFHVCAFLGCSHIAPAPGPQPANRTEIGYCLIQTVSYWWFDLPLVEQGRERACKVQQHEREQALRMKQCERKKASHMQQHERK